MKKVFVGVVLLLLLLMISDGQSEVASISEHKGAAGDIDTTEAMRLFVDSLSLIDWGIVTIDTFQGNWADPSPDRDTTRWYIKEIKEKCDTTYTEVNPANADYNPRIYTRDIKCKSDTLWAEKIQVWLTPEQLQRLLGIITPRKNGGLLQIGVEW